MLQAGSGIETMILEDRDVADPRVEAQHVIALLVDPENFSHVVVVQHLHAARGVGAIDNHLNHLVKAESADPPPQVLQAANRRRSLVSVANLFGITRSSQGPPLVDCRITSGGRLAFISRTERAVSTNAGTSCAERWVANCSGRLARSVAMMTHSLVNTF